MWQFSLVLLYSVELVISAPLVAPKYTGPTLAADLGLDHLAAKNFTICTFPGGPGEKEVRDCCCRAFCELCDDWLGLHQCAPKWRPKCEVVLHATVASYQQAVGRGSAQTIGSSSVTIRSGRVCGRRIDLLAVDGAEALSALPHEMTHVLLADVFPAEPPPRWAEEGLALLMDPAEKRARHDRDLRQAVHTQTTIPLAKFLAGVEYPDTSQRAVFYGQSHSLVEYLTNLESREQFVAYLQLSTRLGYEHALQTVYGMDARELDRKWRSHLGAVQLVSGGSR
jgi:hypothetical protein